MGSFRTVTSVNVPQFIYALRMHTLYRTHRPTKEKGVTLRTFKCPGQCRSELTRDSSSAVIAPHASPLFLVATPTFSPPDPPQIPPSPSPHLPPSPSLPPTNDRGYLESRVSKYTTTATRPCGSWRSFSQRSCTDRSARSSSVVHRHEGSPTPRLAQGSPSTGGGSGKAGRPAAIRTYDTKS